MRATRILIADDHVILRSGLQEFLERRGQEWTIVGTAEDGEEAVAKARALRPDIVILDLDMPRKSGLVALEEIKVACPACEILVFTGLTSETDIAAAFRAGARGYLVKSEGSDQLIAALEALRSHKLFYSSQVAGLYLQGSISEEIPPSDLTGREREILGLAAGGESSKEIALSLGISAKTVETHRGNLFRKLKLRSVAELVRYAIRHRLIKP